MNRRPTVQPPKGARAKRTKSHGVPVVFGKCGHTVWFKGQYGPGLFCVSAGRCPSCRKNGGSHA